MKTVWFNLLVSALTDALTAFVASILAVMSEVKDLPSKFSLMFAAGGAALIALRTIQQALKATPQITAALKGEEPPVVIPVRQAPAVLKPEVTEPHHLYGQ